ADKPLNAWRGTTLVDITEQPAFLHRTPGIMGPWQRMARTLDDHFFYGLSLWATQRAERSSDGRRPILNAQHVLYDDWRINDLDQIEVRNLDGGWDVADEDEVLLIPGASEGLLAYATRTLAGSRDLEQAWITRARNPSPITELHITDDTQLEADEM